MVANRAQNRSEELMKAHKLALSGLGGRNIVFDVCSIQLSPEGQRFHGDRSHRCVIRDFQGRLFPSEKFAFVPASSSP